MGMESIHDDIDSNRRKRQLSKGSLEDRVEALEQIIAKIVDKTKLNANEKKKLKRIEDAETAHPEKDDQ